MEYYAIKIRIEKRDSERFSEKAKWDIEHGNVFSSWGGADDMRKYLRGLIENNKKD